MSDLAELVTDRLAGAPPDGHQALKLLGQDMHEGFGPTDNHDVPWNAAGWARRFEGDPAWKERIERLSAGLAPRSPAQEGWVMIRRCDVFAAGEHDPVDLFLGALAWGFGNRGYGWRRARDIIRGGRQAPAGPLGPESADRIAGAVAAIRQGVAGSGPAGAWRAWSNGGRARLPGMNTAFASKVAYFACYDRATCSGPLIADVNTAWAMWGLLDCWDIRTDADLYARYVETAEGWAKDIERRSDDIERALFQLGPTIRQEWQQRQ